jgi:hypothetical protein
VKDAMKIVVIIVAKFKRQWITKLNSFLPTETSQYFSHRKYFETLEEMLQYCENWGDMPLDLKEFENQMKIRIQEAKDNYELRGGNFTNRDAYRLLRMSTDWVDHV